MHPCIVVVIGNRCTIFLLVCTTSGTLQHQGTKITVTTVVHGLFQVHTSGTLQHQGANITVSSSMFFYV